MDISSLLSQTNLVSIVFFFITTLLIGYEFILFTKDRGKKSKPVVPGFSAAKSAPLKSTSARIQPPHAFKKNSLAVSRNTIGAIAGIVILATTGLIVYLTVQNNNKSALPPISSQAQTADEQTTLLDLGIQNEATAAAQTATDTTSTDSGNLASETLATPTPTLVITSTPIATDEPELVLATDEATTTALDDTDVDTTDVIAAADPTPTPITSLPLSSTYQYFFTAIAAAATIIVVSLVI